MINKNIRGVILLFGMVFSLMATTIIYNLFNFTSNENARDICIPFTMNSINYFSKLPINSKFLLETIISPEETPISNISKITI